MEQEQPRGDGTGSSPASVLTVLEGMRALGVDIDEVCAASGLSIAGLDAREDYVPSHQLATLWREATRLFGRPTLGIHVGMVAPFGRMIVDYVASTSATLRDALQQVGRYHRLITRNADMRLRPEGALTLFELMVNLPRPAIPAQVVEYAITCVVRRVFAFTGKPAREARFPHPPLGPRQEYARVLGVPAHFEVERPGVLLDEQGLEAPCRGQDPNLYRLLHSHAELLLARESDARTFRAQVRRIVVMLVAHGELEVGRVARALATSERSLQRRLRSEGSSFRAVVDGARQELALSYLGDARLSVGEVAYLLGYGEAGAFARAFKRWTGRTPGEARTSKP